MKKFIIMAGLLIVAFVALESSYPTTNSKKIVSTTKPDSDCLANPEWFLDTHVPSNKEPQKGNECQFYQWAWETFLYITRPSKSGGQPKFLDFQTPTELFGNDATPLFKQRSDRMLTLAPRVEEDSVVAPLSEVLQANSHGILVDQNGHVVYYAQHVNKVFADFVTQNHLNNMASLLAFSPDTPFRSGSLELKSSWKIVVPGEDVSQYYTTKAWVAKFVIINGKTQINPTQTRLETVALLAIHVVGVVNNHPEFIWATFEHDGLAPNLSGTNIKPTDPVDADPTHHWLLYATGTPVNQCNQNNRSTYALKDPVKQTFMPITPVYHLFSEGDTDDQIVPLNKSVKDKLKSMGSVWQYYSFKGAVWLNDPGTKFLVNHDFTVDDKKDSTIIGGEKNLSNVTMETFTQAGERCFSCHKTQEENSQALTFPAKKIGISHVITNAWFNSQVALANKANLMKRK